MSATPPPRTLAARLTASIRFGSPVTWFRWLVLFSGIAVTVAGCKMTM